MCSLSCNSQNEVRNLNICGCVLSPPTRNDKAEFGKAIKEWPQISQDYLTSFKKAINCLQQHWSLMAEWGVMEGKALI